MVEIKARELVTIEKKYIPKIDWGNLISEEVEKSFRIRKSVVRKVLNEWEASRNNDFIMFIECLRDEFGVQVTSGKDNFHIVIPRDLIFKIPSPETYTRCRRLIQAQGDCLPTNPRVLEMRSLREKAIRKYIQNLKGGKND